MTGLITTKTCSQCREDKPWIFLGKLSGRNRKLYHDEIGRQWYCAVCPECRYDSIKLTVKAQQRKCSGCSAPLKGDRYFTCTECLPELGEDLGDLVYHVA